MTYLKDRRLEVGMTQSELALKVGLSRISISRYENGKRKLDTDTFGQICEALRVPQYQRMELIREFGKRKEE